MDCHCFYGNSLFCKMSALQFTILISCFTSWFANFHHRDVDKMMKCRFVSDLLQPMVHFSHLVHNTGVEQARNSQLVSDAMWAIQGKCGACLGSGPSGGSLYQCHIHCQNCAQSEGWLLLSSFLFVIFSVRIG